MSRRTGGLEPPRGFLEQFARNHPSVTDCTCTGDKVSGPSHRRQPNAIVTKMGDFNIDINVDHVFVGVRHKGQAFSCRLMTDEPNRVKKDLVEALKQYR